EPVEAPFPDIAVHVEQTEGIRGIRPNRTGPLEISSLRTLATWVVAVEVSLGGSEGVADVEGRVRSRPFSTRIFPFRLGRQAIGSPHILLLWQLGKPLAERHRLVPRDRFDGETPCVQLLHHFLPIAGRAEPTRVVSHDALILLLRDLE